MTVNPAIPRWSQGEKSKNMGPTLLRLLHYFGKYRWYIYIGSLLTLVCSVLTVIGPTYLSELTNVVADGMSEGSGIDLGRVTQLGLCLVALYATAFLCEAAGTRLAWVAEEINGDMLRKLLSEKISRISVGTLDSMRSGDIMSRFANDTDNIRSKGADCFTNMASAVSMFIGCIVMMFVTDWRLALITMAPSILGFLGIRAMIRWSQKYYRIQAKDLGRMNNLVSEVFDGLDVVSVYNGVEAARERYVDINESLYVSAFRSRFVGGMMPQITGFVNNVGYVLVCIAGALFILEGTASYGTVVAFIVYAKLLNMPLTRIAGALANVQMVAVSCERVFEFLDTPEMEDESGKADAPEDVEGRVDIVDVSFSYVPGKEVLHGLSISASPGQRIAIVGPTGAGKTTIANLLLRFYDADSGKISIDGTDITEIRREEVRRLFSVVLQEAWMLRGTIRENITLGNEGISDSAIEEACDAVGMAGYLRSLPDGLDTFIKDPSSLSAGQRQQINIARALVKDAPLLILDEATSSVDTRTERRIQEAMDRLMRGRTSFVIAHRLSTIKAADRILVIRKGKVVEQGTHEELLAMNGFYRDLYDSQFESCERFSKRPRIVGHKSTIIVFLSPCRHRFRMSKDAVQESINTV